MKREFVIKLVGLQGISMKTEHDGRFLASFDASKHDLVRAPLGGIKSVDDAGRALMFYTAEDAKKFWAQQHGIRAIDGRPNRPLTAYVIQIERIVSLI